MASIAKLSHIIERIQRNYPNCEVVGLKEVYHNNKWINNNLTVSAYTSPESIVFHFNWLIDKGVEWVQFIIKDEYNTIRYPDYKLSEFTKDVAQ